MRSEERAVWFGLGLVTGMLFFALARLGWMDWLLL